MADEPENHTLRLLREMREETNHRFDEMNRRSRAGPAPKAHCRGALAEGAIPKGARALSPAIIALGACPSSRGWSEGVE